MARIRVIPTLLLRGRGFVKTARFDNPVYLGDPVNIVRIFNDKEADELAILDIRATPERRGPLLDLLRDVAGECFMPLSYGGGVGSVEDMHALFAAGFEKVYLNTRAFEDSQLVRTAAGIYGSQSVVVSIDVKKNWLGHYEVRTHGGRSRTGLTPVRAARLAEELGAGEILLTSIDREGTYQGYDVELLRQVTSAVSIPVVASGGAGKLDDFAAAVYQGGASAVAAGSFFVFHGPHRAVLINMPSPDEFDRIFHTGSAARGVAGLQTRSPIVPWNASTGSARAA